MSCVSESNQFLMSLWEKRYVFHDLPRFGSFSLMWILTGLHVLMILSIFLLFGQKRTGQFINDILSDGLQRAWAWLQISEARA